MRKCSRIHETLLQRGLGRGVKPRRVNQGLEAAALLPAGERARWGGAVRGVRALPCSSVLAGVKLLRPEPKSQNCVHEVAIAGTNVFSLYFKSRLFLMYPKVSPLIIADIYWQLEHAKFFTCVIHLIVPIMPGEN